MEEPGDKDLILSIGGKKIAVRVREAEAGPEITPVPVRGGRPAAIKITPMGTGGSVALLRLEDGREVRLTIGELPDSPAGMVPELPDAQDRSEEQLPR
ncbi:MAG TPA: hypothetical protein VEI81_02515 [Methanoregula sp.]|nr:hypothetical protein [Methanoregula sp.]